MAIYPTLFALYLGRLVPGLGAHATLVGAAVVAAGAAYNLRGARAVGRGSEAMALVLLAPFAILTVLAMRAGDPPLGPAALRVAPDLSGAVLLAMWNTMGWDNVSTVASEVSRPRTRSRDPALFAVSHFVVPFFAS